MQVHAEVQPTEQGAEAFRDAPQSHGMVSGFPVTPQFAHAFQDICMWCMCNVAKHCPYSSLSCVVISYTINMSIASTVLQYSTSELKKELEH